MKKNRFKSYGFLLFIAFLMVACAGTEITQKQIEDAYTGKPASASHERTSRAERSAVARDRCGSKQPSSIASYPASAAARMASLRLRAVRLVENSDVFTALVFDRTSRACYGTMAILM